MPATPKRTRLLVDPSFQLRLVFLMGWRLLICTVLVFHIYFLSFATWSFADSSVRKSLLTIYVEFISQERLIFVTLAVVCPMVMYQMFKFSHRIAGPLFRCRQILRDIAAGKEVQEFRPRKYDLLENFVGDLNTLIRASNARLRAQANGHLANAKAANGTASMPNVAADAAQAASH
jgi:hypothetical protein